MTRQNKCAGQKIVTIKHIVVPTETDALLLENNLIKTLQPRYNVLFAMIKATLGSVLRKICTYFATRRMVKDGSEYFGP
jgi:excinuclease ABC subunit C